MLKIYGQLFQNKIGNLFIFLYILIMNYFSNIEWVGFNHDPECTALVDKEFVDYYVLMYAHSGTLSWQKNRGKPVLLKAPVAWWTFPGTHFKFGQFDKEIWDHRFVSFRGKRVEDWISKELFDSKAPRPFKPISNSIQFAEEMDKLMQQLESPISVSNARAIHQLEGLLLLLNEDESIVNTISPAEEKVQGIIEKVKKAPAVEYDFHQIASELYLSYSHFRRLFKLISGFAPNQFVLLQRMAEASRLLRLSNLGIKEIAEQVKCEDIYYFSKMFKKTYQIPPGKYRKGSVNV